jgi:hypothetical protein
MLACTSFVWFSSKAGTRHLIPHSKVRGLGTFWNISRTSHVSNEIPHDSFVPKLVISIKEDGDGLSSPENLTIKQFGQ